MNNMNLASHLKNLTTIKDFDFGVSSSTSFTRVSELTNNVTQSEVNLIVWLLLEKEFEAERTQLQLPDDPEECHLELQSGGSGKRGSTSSNSCSDSTDASKLASNKIQADGHRRHYSGSKNLSKRDQALRYAEDLLAAVGVSIPFEQLSSEQRRDLFQLFCSSSNLLLQEKFSSILDLYNALRRRSKFREEFYQIKSLGIGSFGKVYSVRKRLNQSGEIYALKKVVLTLDLVDLIPMILNESSILKTLVGHKSVVQYYDSWLAMEHENNEDDDDENFMLADSNNSVFSNFQQDDNTSSRGFSSASASSVEYDEGSYVFYLLMEKCWISLREWRGQCPEDQLSTSQLRQISYELIDGLEWIHSKGFLHLDINPKNILWKNENKSSVVITDFGLAVEGPTHGERVGTTPYCAPEKILNAKSDIYSLGVSLFEVCQRFSTRSEFSYKLEARDLTTGAELIDQMLPFMLHHRHQQRLSATELKQRFFGSSSTPD